MLITVAVLVSGLVSGAICYFAGRRRGYDDGIRKVVHQHFSDTRPAALAMQGLAHAQAAANLDLLYGAGYAQRQEATNQRMSDAMAQMNAATGQASHPTK